MEFSVLFANSVGPYQTHHSTASDLDLHWLSMSLLGDSRLTWVKLHVRSSIYLITTFLSSFFFFYFFPPVFPLLL